MKTTGWMILIFVAAVLAGCGSSAKTVTETAEGGGGKYEAVKMPAQNIVPGYGSAAAMPKAVIYKTTADYSDNVPLVMDAAKKTLVSYPDPIDVMNSRPFKLDNGYWLDNRGINENVVFTDYTYMEYAQLQQVPSVEELMKHIIDYNPLLEMYVSVSPRVSVNDAQAYNQAIQRNFAGFTRVR